MKVKQHGTITLTSVFIHVNAGIETYSITVNRDFVMMESISVASSTINKLQDYCVILIYAAL